MDKATETKDSKPTDKEVKKLHKGVSDDDHQLETQTNVSDVSKEVEHPSASSHQDSHDEDHQLKKKSYVSDKEVLSQLPYADEDDHKFKTQTDNEQSFDHQDTEQDKAETSTVLVEATVHKPKETGSLKSCSTSLPRDKSAVTEAGEHKKSDKTATNEQERGCSITVKTDEPTEEDPCLNQSAAEKEKTENPRYTIFCYLVNMFFKLLFCAARSYATYLATLVITYVYIIPVLLVIWFSYTVFYIFFWSKSTLLEPASKELSRWQKIASSAFEGFLSLVGLKPDIVGMLINSALLSVWIIFHESWDISELSIAYSVIIFGSLMYLVKVSCLRRHQNIHLHHCITNCYRLNNE